MLERVTRRKYFKGHGLLSALALLFVALPGWASQPLDLDACLGRFNDLMKAEVREYEDISLPGTLAITVGDHDSAQMHAFAQKAWSEIYSPEEFHALMVRLSDKTYEASKKERKFLKDARKRGLLLRYVYRTFQADHKTPERIEQFVKTFGKLNDRIGAKAEKEKAIEEGEAVAGGKEKSPAKLAKSILEQTWGPFLMSEIDQFHPASAASVLGYLRSSLDYIQARINKTVPISIDEYHDVRKDSREFLYTLRLMAAAHPEGGFGEAIDYLNAVNNEIGDMLKGVPKKAKEITVPQSVREKVVKISDLLRQSMPVAP